MRYTLTAHARKRMRERSIPRKLIADALHKPTEVSYDAAERILIKKLYRRNGTERLLLIAGEMQQDVFRVITVIDTSKVRKYL